MNLALQHWSLICGKLKRRQHMGIQLKNQGNGSKCCGMNLEKYTDACKYFHWTKNIIGASAITQPERDTKNKGYECRTVRHNRGPAHTPKDSKTIGKWHIVRNMVDYQRIWENHGFFTSDPVHRPKGSSYVYTHEINSSCSSFAFFHFIGAWVDSVIWLTYLVGTGMQIHTHIKYNLLWDSLSNWVWRASLHHH